MFVGMGLGRFSYSAMVPALVATGGLTPVEAGRIGMTNLIGFAAGALLSVWLLRFFRRATLLRLALLMAMAGLALSAAPWGHLWLALCRAVLGLATG